MDTKIFLKGFDSKQSVSNNSSVNVSLDGKRKLLPFDDTSYTINAYDQYTKERESCETIRLTCQVNTVCTNVLFNKITEIVKDEGSSGVTFLNYGVGNDDSVFDTVKFKPQNMRFWSGSTCNYQSTDLNMSSSYNSQIKTLINSPYSTYNFDETSSLTPANAIRDMQLSKNDSKGNHFVYHCGLDIFNNHLIRSKTFKPICTIPSSFDEYHGFNTIADVMRCKWWKGY